MKIAFSYYRVSNLERGNSGLALDAQRQNVSKFCTARGYRLVESWLEAESGKQDERPALREALRKAKARGATIIIAKLGQLSHNIAFLMTLRDSGVPFIAVDMPRANAKRIRLMVEMAQAERDAISTRISAALAEIPEKARQRIGEAGRKNISDMARAKAAQAKRARALGFYNVWLVDAKALRSKGWSYQDIADKLNEAGATARRGGRLTAKHVQRLLIMAHEAGIFAKALRSKGWSYRRIADELNGMGGAAQRGERFTATRARHLLRMVHGDRVVVERFWPARNAFGDFFIDHGRDQK